MRFLEFSIHLTHYKLMQMCKKMNQGLKLLIGIFLLFLFACSLETKSDYSKQIMGSWQLMTGTLIEKKDTVITHYDKNIRFIKIINSTHFAFLQHDLSKGKNADSTFAAGGGKYRLKGDEYTEYLEYCSDRNWEAHDFKFTIEIKNDTLIQRGVEKIDSLGINRLNIEKYIKLTQ